MEHPVVIASGLGAGEGPTWCEDGTVVVTSVDQGVLYRIRPGDGEKHVIATTGGGPNGATPAAGGGFVVTQNGGFDFSLLGLNVPKPQTIASGLQIVDANGAVTYLTNEGFAAPNDLVVDAEGTLFFTDPPRFPYDPEARGGRVWSLRRGGQPQLVAAGFAYCNGIGIGRDGGILVIEAQGLVRVHPDGSFDWVVEQLANQGGGDGFCFDVEGRAYVCTSNGQCVRVFEGSTLVEVLAVPFDGPAEPTRNAANWVTNCCFGGDDLRTLFVTTAFPGQLVAIAGMPTAGARVHAF